MKRYGLFLALLASCATEKPLRQGSSISILPLNTCEAIQTLFKTDLSDYQDRVDEASKNYQEEQWRVETADPKASNEKLSKLFSVMQEKAYDKTVLEQVLTLWKATRDLKGCALLPKLERAKTLLETTIITDPALIKKEKENQDLQDAMGNKSNAFRVTVEGEKEPVSEALLSKKLANLEDRALREKLHKAHKGERAKAWLGWGFRDLIKARNDEAKIAGYPNYYEYHFFRTQLDFKNYRDLVRDVKTKLSPKLKKVIREWGNAAGITKVEPWDLRYLRRKASSGDIDGFLKEVPESVVLDFAKRFWSGLGIDVDSYGFTMDLYPRSGKNTHAFAMGVVPYHVNEKKEILLSPKPDIRFLANLKKPVVWDDISTVIHELGHAIHFGEIRQPNPIFRGFGSVETEAIAMTVERMADSEEFLGAALKEFTKASQKELSPILKEHLKAARVEQAFTLLRQVFFSDFEYEIYKNPMADYAAIWRKMHLEYWGVDVPVEFSDWDVDHFLMSPAYVQNYAIGIVMVEQFFESILKEFKTSYRSTVLGNKLKNVYFAPGLEYSYLELTKQFTGKPLTAKAALKLIP